MREHPNREKMDKQRAINYYFNGRSFILTFTQVERSEIGRLLEKQVFEANFQSDLQVLAISNSIS